MPADAFRSLHISRKGTLTVELGFEETLDLFTPEGERAWIDDWHPEYLYRAGGGDEIADEGGFVGQVLVAEGLADGGDGGHGCFLACTAHRVIPAEAGIHLETVAPAQDAEGSQDGSRLSPG